MAAGRRRQLEGGAAEAADGAVDGPEEVGQGLVLENRNDEGQGLRGDLALLGTAVRIEHGPGRVKALGRSPGLRKPAGEEEIERGRLRSIPERRGHPDLGEHGARRRVADVGQGEEGRAAESFVAAFG